MEKKTLLDFDLEDGKLVGDVDKIEELTNQVGVYHLELKQSHNYYGTISYNGKEIHDLDSVTDETAIRLGYSIPYRETVWDGGEVTSKGIRFETVKLTTAGEYKQFLEVSKDVLESEKVYSL